MSPSGRVTEPRARPTHATQGLPSALLIFTPRGKLQGTRPVTHVHPTTHTYMYTCAHACTHAQSTRACVPTRTHERTHTPTAPLQTRTLSLGSRLMVLSGRSTRRTLRDLMVLMSFPLEPLEGEATHVDRQAAHLCPEDLGTGQPRPCRHHKPVHLPLRAACQGVLRVDKGRGQVSSTWCPGRAELLDGKSPSPPGHVVQHSHPQWEHQLPPDTMLRPPVGIKWRGHARTAAPAGAGL